VERGQVWLLRNPSLAQEVHGRGVYLTKEEGGRHTPFFTGYRPQFYFRTTDVTGSAKLLGGAEMVMPGDNVSIEVELQSPIAMEELLRFAIREGGKTVGSGVVTKILEYALPLGRAEYAGPGFWVCSSDCRICDLRSEIEVCDLNPKGYGHGKEKVREMVWMQLHRARCSTTTPGDQGRCGVQKID